MKKLNAKIKSIFVEFNNEFNADQTRLTATNSLLILLTLLHKKMDKRGDDKTRLIEAHSMIANSFIAEKNSDRDDLIISAYKIFCDENY
jgi:hypothetical protein